MKILLSYSRLHFDPNKKPKSHKYWGSSASILARSLYEILSKIGQVTYIDSSEYGKVKGMEFDLFVGIINNFYKIWQVARIKKSIYFAVNMHPRERNTILLKFLIKEHLSPVALAGWDLLNFIEGEKGIKVADYILCVGNNTTYNSYIKHGVSKNKIKTLNYGIDSIWSGKSQSILPKQEKRFVYVASEIGLRKGFEIIYSLFTNPLIFEKEFHLDIIGLPTNNYYKQKVEKLKHLLKEKVDYHGWVDSNSEEYWKIINSNDFVIHPSLEEGQVGSVLEAISCSVIPLISKYTGIDFSPLGFLETKLSSNQNLKIILKAFNLSKTEVKILKNKTLEYYREYHQNFRDNLANSLKNCVHGELYPKLSVILPIFNKEKTIKHLLNLLHRVCSEYKNVEVHIIFDGCVDKSEKIVRNYFKDIKSYKATFEKTPNIFEIKTNNLGLKKSTGKYCVILQDDNYILDKNIFFEAVNFLDKNSQVAILGCLAGVNFYPRGTKLEGLGQIAMSDKEVYWRQDEKTDQHLKKRIFEVDACMRGPLIIRKSFFEKYGYLDETYTPFYMDDMDICFRARASGYKVYCLLSNTINASLSIAKYDEKKWKFWNETITRNADIFYSRWKPTTEKNYLWVNRISITRQSEDIFQSYLLKIWIQKDDLFYKAISSASAIVHKFIKRN